MKILTKLLIVRMVINVADSIFYMASTWMLSGGEHATTYTAIAITLFTLPELLTFLIGPIIDRFSPKKILLWVSLAQVFLQIFVIFAVINQQEILLLIFIFFSALLSSITYPIEEVMIPKLVEQSKIVLANSIFSFSYQTLDIIINSLSAFLLIYLSFQNMYLLALAFFALALLLLLRFRYSTKGEDQPYQLKEYFQDIKAGANYFFKHKIILKLSLPLVLLNLFMAVNAVALPFFVRDFENSLVLLGTLGLATGLGGILSNLLTHKISQILASGKMIILFLFLDGIMRLIALLSGRTEIILSFFFLSSLFSGIYNTIFASLYQMLPKEEYIGRVGTFVDSFIAAAMPLGGMIGGVLIEVFGGRNSLMISPALTILAALYYLFDKSTFNLPLINKIERESQ